MKRGFIFLLIVMLMTIPWAVKAETIVAGEPVTQPPAPEPEKMPPAETQPGEETEPMREITVKVLTLNIHSGINWNRQYDLEGLAQFIESVDPDVIGLQEVNQNWWSASQFDDIPAKLAERLGMNMAFIPALDRKGGFFGNLILSKHPLITVRTDLLPGQLEKRSFGLVQVFIDGIRVNFATTHLGLSEADRLQQMTAILEVLNTFGGPKILCGDFNAGTQDPAMTLIRPDWQDWGDGIVGGTFRDKTGAIFAERMDYVLTSPDFALESIEAIDNRVSDHLPVVAVLKLKVDAVQSEGDQVYYP